MACQLGFLWQCQLRHFCGHSPSATERQSFGATRKLGTIADITEKISMAQLIKFVATYACMPLNSQVHFPTTLINVGLLVGYSKQLIWLTIEITMH